jgi:L-ascorbate metabolism protein UlaG (beta-lactamase superfamily)
LGWAGLEIEADGVTVVIDLVEEAEPLRSSIPDGSLVKAQGRATAALVTHLHSDHADPAALKRVLTPDGIVFRPEPMPGPWTEPAETGLSGMPTKIVAEWECTTVGPFELTAVPAVDGLGDPQLNWVVAAGGQRIFHGGDTMFHGHWWSIAARLGPFDAAFLPINGAAVALPHLRPASPLPAVLTPDQAAVAGAILQARQVIPIHYGIHRPPFYVEVDDPATAFRAAARERGITARFPAPGESVQLG